MIAKCTDNANGELDLTIGKEYDVIRFLKEDETGTVNIGVTSDNGFDSLYSGEYFEIKSPKEYAINIKELRPDERIDGRIQLEDIKYKPVIKIVENILKENEMLIKEPSNNSQDKVNVLSFSYPIYIFDCYSSEEIAKDFILRVTDPVDGVGTDILVIKDSVHFRNHITLSNTPFNLSISLRYIDF